jgi:AcrR family transcriptional regulator
LLNQPSECTLTHMTATVSSLSTAEARRETVLESALVVFAQSGYLGTPITAVAAHAQISPAYVFKLFPTKEVLFVATLQRCYDRIQAALGRGAKASSDQTPDGVLRAMGGTYAELIADRTLLMLQVHAQSAADVPEIRSALRQGLQQITTFVQARSGASDEAVQHFIAYGQLCHLVVTAGLERDTPTWARVLTAGLRHP